MSPSITRARPDRVRSPRDHALHLRIDRVYGIPGGLRNSIAAKANAQTATVNHRIHLIPKPGSAQPLHSRAHRRLVSIDLEMAGLLQQIGQFGATVGSRVEVRVCLVDMAADQA